eukprot:2138074-Prymnesium_polylepis.1
MACGPRIGTPCTHASAVGARRCQGGSSATSRWACKDGCVRMGCVRTGSPNAGDTRALMAWVTAHLARLLTRRSGCMRGRHARWGRHSASAWASAAVRRLRTARRVR